MMTVRDSRRVLTLLFKSAVSLALIIWLLFEIDVRYVAVLWRATNWKVLALVAPIMFSACTAINVLRWQRLLKQQGTNMSFWLLVVIYTKSAFFGSFLPGGMSAGDIYRIYSLARTNATTTVSISSVVIDRTMGMLSLLIVSLCALWYTTLTGDTERLLTLSTSFLSVAVVVFAGTALFLLLIRKGYVSRIVGSNRRLVGCQEFIDSIPRYFSIATVAEIFALSVVLQFTIALWTYVVARALNIPVTLDVLCIVTPVVSLVALVPISIGGIGVREAGYVLLLAPFGVEASAAVSISIVSVVLQSILRVVIGAAFFVSSGEGRARSSVGERAKVVS